MAVVSIKERTERRRSSYRDGKRTHIRIFLVQCDDIADGTAVALTAKIMDGDTVVAAVPSPGQIHNKDGSAAVTGLDADPVANSAGLHFDVMVEYTGSGDIALPPDPLDQPPDIGYSYNDSTEPYFIDESTDGDDGKGKPVVNTAGDAFESYLERERGEMVITIAMNEPTHNPAAADEFSHTVNESAVTIDGTTYDKGTLKLSPITAQKIKGRIEDNGLVMDFTYYKRTYVLKARHEGWKDKPLDVGLNELIPDPDPRKPGKVMPIVDGVNGPVRRPWPLDGHGRKKPKPTDKPEELEFMPYKELSWSSLAFTWDETWKT